MLSAAPFVLATLVHSVFAATADDWKSRSIYQIVTDRFSVGNGSFPACNTDDKVYCGGDWWGIIKNLDYIHGMGFDAIWISPIPTNINRTVDGDPYHGYWTGDLYSLNRHFGGNYDIKGLISELHSREMFLMMDFNVNNMAANQTPANVSWLNPFMNDTNYHRQCPINNATDQWELENCWLSDGDVLLPDLNTENQTIADMLYDYINVTAGRYNIDGMRLDKVNNIRKDFWPAFVSNASVFSMGEVNTNDTDYAAGYTDVLDSVLDYPLYYRAQEAFADSKSDLSDLATAMQTSQSKYGKGAFGSGVFIENHDQPRFPSFTKDMSLIKNAIAWTFSTDGMPILYYGQEQLLNGGSKPSNHEALWLKGISKNGPLVGFITALNGARRTAGIANPDFHSTPANFSVTSSQALAIIKPPLLALLSNAGNASTVTWNVTGSDAGYEPGTTLVDVLSCATLITNEDGGVSARSQGGLPLILLPQETLDGSSICGLQALIVGTNNSPRGAAMPWAFTAASLVLTAILLYI